MTTTTNSTNTRTTATEAATVDWLTLNPNITPLKNWETINEEIDGRHSYLIEYYKECRRGNILIGHELQTTLESLMQDILLNSDIYRFTLGGAHKRIQFIEREVKHFEAPFAGKPFLLALCQKAIVEAIFGFYIYDNEILSGARWVRRFKEILLLMGRKNGKTPFIAAIVLADWVCGESGQKVMCASNDYEQSGLIFDCINAFREESRTLAKVTRKNIKGIFFGNPKQRKKTGKFSAQNKASIKKMSARQQVLEGRNLKTVIVDEVHEMQDSTFVLPLQTSLSTQDEPLYFEITTEGIVRDGYLDNRLDFARKILRGEDESPRWLIWLYTQDSETEVWNDERTWQKSNPLLGIAKKWSYLREKVDKASKSSAERSYILAKDFNLKQLSSTAWLRLTDIIGCDGKFKLDDFKKTWCICGVDLAETNDLAACTFLLMKPNDPTKYLHTMYFVTEAKAGDDNATDSPTNPERRNYKQWAEAGFVRIVKGNIIDDDVVAKYILEIYEQYKIRPFKIGYDEWHAKEFVKIITQKLGENFLTKIKMSCESLNVPTRNIETDMQARHINYNSNEICTWCFQNTAIRVDKNGFVMPEKIGGYIGNKIDGTMSKVIAYAALRECKAEFMRKVEVEYERHNKQDEKHD